MRRAGFTFIELSISLFIASILLLMLYNSFEQSRQTVQTVNSMIDAAFIEPVVYNQFEQDIMALFVPNQVFKDIEEQHKKEKQPAGAASEKKEAKEPFKDVFVSTIGADKNVTLFSFLSTHSLVSYSAIKPRSVRIVYRLVADTDNPGFFTLARQESVDLQTPLEKFSESGSKIRSYDLMRGVKKCTMQYVVAQKSVSTKAPDSAKATTGKTSDKQKEEPPKYFTVDTWDAQEIEQKSGAMIPAFVVIKISFVDLGVQREYDVEWRFEVPVYDDVVKRVQEAKTEKKEQKTSDSNQTPREPSSPSKPSDVKPGPANPNKGGKK